MKITILLLLFAFITTLFFSCSFEKQKDIVLIHNSESQIFSDTAIYEKYLIDANNLLSQYSDFITKYPEDAETPDMLFKASNVSMNTKDYNKAVSYLDKLILNYPKSDKTPMALFLLAFIYENNLNDIAKASLLYNQFIKEYPNHEMAASAKSSLENIGKPVEELIQEFDKGNLETSNVN